MDIRQLHYFLAIAEEGQITGAAKRLHMAQPPLSQQLKLLETELGVQLIRRGSRRIQLTEAGSALRNRAEQILALMETTFKEVKEFHDGDKGTLAIGTVASLGATLLPERIRLFREQYPGIDFILCEGETQRISELLNRGVIEIGMVRLPFDSNVFESVTLPKEPMVAAINRSCGSYDDNTTVIQLKELVNMPLMVHRRHEALIIKACREAGFEPSILCIGDDIRSLLAWADAGIGTAIATQSAAGLIPSTNLCYRQIAAPDLETTAAVIWMRNRYLSTAARRFLEIFIA
ncbi:transcription regulator hth lysr [Lucifera butyrica]|uniref:Transcription regulator hth lysr n=1 Tax=Lucifera butyrica TaxID=1351585 RepID=A0A498RG99_9FIRM|nr:LysR family transcriptional regulator [Lucifera butyrica]VBB09102.1 transcription regulator hth lysr [Lucifera butyrica]